MEKICVAVRVRPPSNAGSPSPSRKGHKWIVGAHNVALYSTLGTPLNGQNYSFDHVFGTDASNGDIYRGLTRDVIMSSLDGFNGTVFAYGQTSSGKTYTMKGTPTDPGIIRLAVQDVFNHILQLKNNREFLIRVSYMEIYNEDINDLFAPENRRLRVHENVEKGIFVAGLREEIVDSPEQVFDLLEFGENHRHFGETNMNLYSSRSHTIFRMVIESRDTGQEGNDLDVSCDAVRVSCLNMVDLAGSERISKTGAGGVRLKEGTHINKSLMTLGTVINKLSDGAGKHGGHIPYRDSKLTRILQPALGGNAKTAMICTVTPDEIHIDETKGTLQFASRAKRVRTCAQVNEIVTDAALLKRQTREIEELRMKLQGLPQSAHLEKEILNLRNELLKFELEKERLFLELQEEKKSQVDRERRIKEQEQKIENLSSLFMNSTLDERDAEKLNKKGNRRETWCPRQLNSEPSVLDFRKLSDKVDEDETMDNILYSMRRDRNVALPPAFEIDEECDPFWSGSNGVEEFEPPSDFENIADEDTWMSLNKGHTTTSTVFCPGFSERNRSSAGSGAAHRIDVLESHLKDLQVRYEELQSSCDSKVQETTKELREELARSKQQLDKAQKENVTLQNKLVSQLEMQRELEHVIEDLEFEMDAARLLSCSMQGILAEALHVQALVLVTLQGVSSTKTRPIAAVYFGSPGHKAKERKLLVESSVEKCREICADVEKVLQDRPSRMQAILLESSTQVIEADAKYSSLNANVDGLDLIEAREKIRDIIEAPETIRDIIEAPEILEIEHITEQPFYPAASPKRSVVSVTEVKYCEGCSSSMLSSARTLCNDQAAVSDHTTHRTCQGNAVALATSGVMGSLESSDFIHKTGDSLCHSEDPLDPVHDSLSRVPFNGFKMHVLRALASYSDQHPEHGDSNSRAVCDPGSLLDGLISRHHVGCSFGTLGRNCDNCVNHGLDILGKSQIPAEMSNLCSLILKLFGPSFHVSDSVRPLHNENDSGLQRNGKVKAHLASAKFLATWLLEEVQAVVSHDLDCLRCHVKERGNVGLLLEALQVLLLQIANLSVGLLQVTCQDEDLMKDLLLQLSALKDFGNGIHSAAEAIQEVDAVSESFQQESMGGISIEGDFCKVDFQERESSLSSDATVGPLDRGTQVPVEISAKHTSSSMEIHDPPSNEESNMIERLKMSSEHISTLDRQLAVLNVEKDRIMKVLVEELNEKEESWTASKLEKMRLAKNLKKLIGKMTVHDEVVSTICVGIKDFEKQLVQRRPVLGWQNGRR